LELEMYARTADELSAHMLDEMDTEANYSWKTL
jgi:hypothetical protein